MTNQPDKKAEIRQYLRELEIDRAKPEGREYERQNKITDAILKGGWPAIEVLVDNLNNETPSCVFLNSGSWDVKANKSTIGIVCELLLEKIILPPDKRNCKHPRLVWDWHKWMEEHRGMTIEQVRDEYSLKVKTDQ